MAHDTRFQDQLPTQFPAYDAKPLFDGEHADETRATMAWVIEQAITMLHPIMPFVTEEIWALTGARAKMLVHGDWPGYGAELIDEHADRQMNWVIGLIEGVRSARAQMGVPAGAKLDLIVTDDGVLTPMR
mgnify:CR=1 FL=1